MTSTPDFAARHVVLTGPMGAGKTTVGRILATRLGSRFIDSDEQIETRFGMTSRRLAEQQGVESLHEAEAWAFREALACDRPLVVAAAASIADRPELIDLLAETGAFVVVLRGDGDVLATRTRTGGHRRPLPEGEATRLAGDRGRRLVGVAGLTVDVTRLGPAEVAAVIVAAAPTTG